MGNCYHCKKRIEDWASDNKDEEGNEYCMNCLAKIQLVAEQTGQYYD